ncbi:hypothetical protein KJ966_26530 [bacterium]|nr:hypothetical protein [bacterium]
MVCGAFAIALSTLTIVVPKSLEDAFKIDDIVFLPILRKTIVIKLLSTKGAFMKSRQTILFLIALLVPMSLVAATSSENRSDSMFFIGMSPIGVHAATILTRPYNVGFYLGSSFMVGFEYGKVNDSDYEHTYLDKKYEGEDAGESTNVSGSYANEGIFARVFSNDSSLNLYLAYHVRTWDGEGTLTKDSGEAEAEMTFKSNTATMGIGNMWQFDSGLTIGINWYVDSRILDQSLDYKITSNTGIPEAEVIEEIEDFGKFLNAVSGLFGFFVVTAGISF